DNLRVFAAGSPTNVMSIEVLWRSGKNSLVTNATANRIYEIDEGNAIAADASPPATRHPPLFEDVSQLISHEHHDEPFDDFQRQPLLPKKLSQLGPGLAWGDIDGDGWDDLVIGTGKGGHLAAYRNTVNGHFMPFTGATF